MRLFLKPRALSVPICSFSLVAMRCMVVTMVSIAMARKSTGSTERDGELLRQFNDTPQNRITNIDNYMTEVTKEGNEATEKATGTASVAGSGTSEHDSKETYTLTRRGNIGVQTKGEEFEKNRRAILNVDAQVIEELECLFLQIY